MSLWTMFGIVFSAGALGGILSAVLTDQGFIFPKVDGGILRPGWLGTVLIGGAASALSWMLYGPFAAAHIDAAKADPGSGLTFAAVAGAVLVGIGGSKWLTNESDKQLLRAAGVAAAKAGQTPDLANTIKDASPAKALQAAQLAVSAAIRQAGRSDSLETERKQGPDVLPPGPKLD